MSVKNAIRNLIDAADTKTGYTHLDLKSAVQTLCDGYNGTVGTDTPTEVTEGACESLNSIRDMLYKANVKTGVNHTDLTDAVQTLCDGYTPKTPLYSFGVTSDLHLQYATGQSDFERALAYFDRKGIPFSCVCGDLTWAATMVNADKYTTEWKGGLEDYKDIIGGRTNVYAIGGNHECYTATYDVPTGKWTSVDTGLDVELFRECTGCDPFYTVSGNPTDTVNHNVYNSSIADTDVFIMLSIKKASAPNLWLDGEWEWLQSTLEANKNKRCFVFFHEHDNDDKTADPFGLYQAGISEATAQGKAFIELMRQYKNVIWFHGHTHTTFLEDQPPVATIFARGYKSVNIPSLQGPRKWNPETGTNTGMAGNSECYIVDVFENHIVLKALDLTTVNADGTGEATVFEVYALDTVADSTGIITPSLLPSVYQQVEYIATDGNQIIDTLVIPSDHKDGIWYELDFRSNWDGSLNSNDYVWGCISGASRSGNLYYNRSAGNSRLVCGTTLGGITYNWYDITTRTIVRVFATSEDTSSLRLEYEQNGEVKNPTVNSSTYDTAPMPSESIYLFNCRGISRQGTPIMCYGFNMKAADGTQIRNFVPCYRKADNVIGMYDTITQQFYTNAGTGSFTKGADV